MAVVFTSMLAAIAKKDEVKEQIVEKHLLWVVQSLEESVTTVDGENVNVDVPRKGGGGVMLGKGLPFKWGTEVDIAAPFDELGALYARNGKLECVFRHSLEQAYLLSMFLSRAMTMYLRAISILIHLPPQYSSTEDQCRGSSPPFALVSLFDASFSSAAHIMIALSRLILNNTPSSSKENLHQANLWAGKALEMTRAGCTKAGKCDEVCEVMRVLALYHAGVLKRVC